MEMLLTAVVSVDARSQMPRETRYVPTSLPDLQRSAAATLGAPPWLTNIGRSGRREMLEVLAPVLADRAHDVITLADRESALGVERLGMELARSAYQLRF